MFEHDENDSEAAALWSAYRAFGRDAPGALGPDLIAAWLDGRCAQEDGDEVERALSADPDLLESVLAAREALRGAETGLPEGLVGKARAAAAGVFAMPARASTPVSFARKWWRVAAAAILIAVASASGFAVGSVHAPARAGSSSQLDPAEVVAEGWDWGGFDMDSVVEATEEQP